MAVQPSPIHRRPKINHTKHPTEDLQSSIAFRSAKNARNGRKIVGHPSQILIKSSTKTCEDQRLVPKIGVSRRSKQELRQVFEIRLVWRRNSTRSRPRAYSNFTRVSRDLSRPARSSYSHRPQCLKISTNSDDRRSGDRSITDRYTPGSRPSSMSSTHRRNNRPNPERATRWRPEAQEELSQVGISGVSAKRLKPIT